MIGFRALVGAHAYVGADGATGSRGMKASERAAANFFLDGEEPSNHDRYEEYVRGFDEVPVLEDAVAIRRGGPRHRVSCAASDAACAKRNVPTAIGFAKPTSRRSKRCTASIWHQAPSKRSARSPD